MAEERKVKKAKDAPRAAKAAAKPAAKPEAKPDAREAPQKPAAKPTAPKPAATQPKPAAKPAPRQPEKVSPSPNRPPERRPETPATEAPKPAAIPGMLLFNRWDTSGVVVHDMGLRKYMNLVPMAVPRTGGKYGSANSQKHRMPLVERFMNKLMVSGHRGKKHKLTSGCHTGKAQTLYNQVKESFAIIEKRTNKNPVQVLVDAIENSALLEEVASYRLGGIIARNSVITSPQRRLDIALKHLCQGIYRSSFRNRQSLASAIANDLIAAAGNDSKSFAVSERNRIEREAEGAR